MKRLLPAVLAVFLGMASAAAQDLEEKVLFTLAPDEQLYMGEFAYSRIAGADKYCCVVQNMGSGELSFIWNGQRIITAPFLEVCCFDLENLNNCVYIWSEPETSGEKWFIRNSYGLYGPYETLQYLPSCEAFGMKRPGGLGIDHPSWLYKDSFVFCQYGQTYVCQSGAIVKLGGDSDWMEYVRKMSSPGISPNGRHFASLNGDVLMCDGKIHYFRVPENAVSADCCALDDGKVYLSFNSGEEVFISFILDPYKMELSPLEKDEMFYDFRSLDVVEKPYDGVFNFDSFNVWQANDLEIQDAENEHIMTVDCRNGFVLVDGIPSGDSPAVFARYDFSADEFIWISEYGGEIKKYTCRL